MGFRKDLRARLQAIQQPINGIIRAELSIPPMIHNAQCPLFVNFLERTDYTSRSGHFSVAKGDLTVTMRLYLGVFNTVSDMEDLVDIFEPRVESAFLGNTVLALNNAPFPNIESRLLSNSGLTVQPYVAGDSDSDQYGVIEFPLIISIDKYSGEC